MQKLSNLYIVPIIYSSRFNLYSSFKRDFTTHFKVVDVVVKNPFKIISKLTNNKNNNVMPRPLNHTSFSDVPNYRTGPMKNILYLTVLP